MLYGEIQYYTHCDIPGSFSMEQVPGRNDDGSGTISILNIAQTGMIFRSNVELVALAVKNVFYWIEDTR
ncbi:hypothetical protein EDC04DRAFT_1849584 [Pisolithus marmoratus]|nr:hypothetical protein EDC04DRAFT_1849584 [Pisolithus marmoratus]